MCFQMNESPLLVLFSSILLLLCCCCCSGYWFQKVLFVNSKDIVTNRYPKFQSSSTLNLKYYFLCFSIMLFLCATES